MPVACTFSIRVGGVTVAECTVPHGASTCLTVPSALRRDDVVCALRWSSGSRHLHLPPLFPSALPLSQLISGPTVEDDPSSGPSAILESILNSSVRNFCRLLPERGLGIEIELVTLDFATPSARTAIHSKFGDPLPTALDDLIHRVMAVSIEAVQLGPAERLRLSRLLNACLSWRHAADSTISGTSEPLAREILTSSTQSLFGQSDEEDSWYESRLRMLMVAPGTCQSEFRSPQPPHELSFAHGAYEEIATFIRLLSLTRAAMPPIGLTGHSATSVHVHVNVRNTAARGEELTALQLVGVFLTWVRFDLVTSRFARPWIRRSKWCAPMYATGREFLWSEASWQQGTSTAAEYANGLRMPEARLESEEAHSGDVYLFLRAVHALVTDNEFASLPEPQRVRRIFGYADSSPARLLGRFISLNVLHVCNYGTLEFRRFESSFDESRIVAWAHFVVSFVECFSVSSKSIAADFCAVPFDDAVEALQMAQECATAADLLDLMSSYCDPDLAGFLQDTQITVAGA